MAKHGSLVALVRRGRHLVRRDRAAAMLDQVLLAGARLAALIVFARTMEIEPFGAFALVVAIGFMLNNLQRSVIVLPFIIACRDPENFDQAVQAWTWIDVVATGLVFLVLLAAWAIWRSVDADPWIATALLVSALSTPALMAFSFLRRVGYQAGRHRSVIAMVAVHACAYVLGILAVLAAPGLELLPLLVPVIAPLAGAAFGALAFRSYIGRPPPRLWATYRASLDLTRWAFLGNLAASVYTSGMSLIVAGLMGATGSAALQAGRTLVSPVASLTTANDMVDKPRAGRAFAARGHEGLHRSARNTALFLLVLGTPYLVLIAAFPGAALELVYGVKYADLEFELRLWALIMGLTLIINPIATYLVTLQDTRSIFRCNLAGAVVTLAVALPLVSSLGIVAALLAMAAGRVANVALLALVARRSHVDGTG